jgi:hypothetical protein
MACTKRLIGYTIEKRLFTITSKIDKYQLHLQYKLQTPNREYWVIANMHPTDLYAFNKWEKLYFPTEEDAYNFLEEMKNGKCLECDNIAYCKFKEGQDFLDSIIKKKDM